MGMPQPQPRLAHVKEACTYGKFSRAAAYRLIRDGKLVAYKMGRSTMIDLDSIDAYHRSLPRVMPLAK